MVRTISTLLGIGLLILWIAGLASPAAAGWLTWLDFVAALIAFGIASSATANSSRAMRSGSTIALSIGLFALWVIGLATGVVAWLAWWTFAFACAFLILGIAAAFQPPRAIARPEQPGIDRERPRRSA